MNKPQQNFWKSLGPGILFAGAAIGTSHLVQSTRAGAMFGLGLLGIIIFANVIKYPAYRFGPHYAAATGKSLIDGYRSLGTWVVVLIGLIEFPVMAIIISATAITTAAIFLAIFNLSWDARYIGCLLIFLAGGLTLSGGYSLLDKLTKIFVLILTVCTFVATAIAVQNVEFNFLLSIEDLNFETFVFVIALIGFMPAGMELSIIHSLWTVEKIKKTSGGISIKAATLDLNIGYVLSATLAVFFVVMGSSVMYSEQIEPATSAAAFANQIISLYTTTLGEWSGTVVGLAALSVMFTTLLTVLDGMPRLLSKILESLELNNSAVNQKETATNHPPYFLLTIFSIAILAVSILIFLMRNFTSFIDFVTIVSFLVAPVIAVLNHLVIFGKTVAIDKRPRNLMRIWSLLAIVFLVTLSLCYFYFLIFN